MKKNYPNHSVQVVITGPSACGKTCSLIECFEDHISLKSINKVLQNKKTVEDLLSDENFKPSKIEIPAYENIDELKYPQEYTGESTMIILDDLNEKEMNDPRIKALFKRSRHNNI